MKKILISLSVILFIGTISSCKKNRVCECKMTIQENGREITNQKTLIDVTKDDAEETCKQYEDYYNGAATCKVL